MRWPCLNIGEKEGATLASLYAGIIFGIFWIPLRALDEAGFHGPWAAMVYSALPALLVSPIYWLRRDELRMANWKPLMGGVLGGVAMALYSLSFLYTEVMRAVLLFYMMPIWGFMLGRIVLNDPITPPRWLAIGFGFLGMGIILGTEAGLPLPKNAGDWMALGSGITFAFAAIMMLVDEKVSVWTHGANFFAVSALISGIAGFLMIGSIGAPDWGALGSVLVWLIPVALLVTVPGGFATLYGPTKLNPGVVSLLFMLEIGVAAITATILTDEPFGARHALGVLLITCAGLFEPARDFLRVRVQKTARTLPDS